MLNPDEAIKDVVNELKVKSDQKGLTLNVVKSENPKMVNADPLRLQEVLTNLIDNAIKYTEQGEITINLTPKDDELIFEIKDTGRGIAPEHMDNLFQKFYREDSSLSASNPQTGGTGLGLYITKGLVEAMNGKIWVESELKKGSKFCFSLKTTSLSEPIKKEDSPKEEQSSLLQKPSENVYYNKK